MANHPYKASIAGTATLVKTGYTQVFWLSVSNRDASERWVQIFNAKAASAVTLGSTTPTHAFPIPASSTLFIDRVPFDFTDGVVLAVTTTETGATGASTAAVVNARIG
jgi:hypothetical protein